MILRVCAISIFTLTSAWAAEGILDRVDESLTISALHDRVRARLSGTLDIEAYHFDTPAPALIATPEDSLFNPRLTLFLDAQLGSQIYVFAQARADRGFDPGDRDAEVRLDEYAVRITPWSDGRFSLQAGKFATVIGNWAQRHGSWENPLITAPLPYENVTGIWDSAAADSSETLLGWGHVSKQPGAYPKDEYRDKFLRNPIIWGPAYTSGLAIFGQVGKFDYAADFKNSSLSSRPESWDGTRVQWQHPTWSGRLGFHPNEKWKLGLSASTGSYLHPDASPSLARGHSLNDYREIVLGQDIGFAWHQWQVWAEFYEARFEIPTVSNVDTFAWYLEAKYKFTPQLFGALRWNQHLFGDIRDTSGERVPWGRDLIRADTAVGYRFTAHTQLKLQYSLSHENGPLDYSHSVAAQLTVRF